MPRYTLYTGFTLGTINQSGNLTAEGATIQDAKQAAICWFRNHRFEVCEIDELSMVVHDDVKAFCYRISES
jgi:hypothetical protein